MFCLYHAPPRAASGLPPQSQRAIIQLGKDIALARRRRKMPQRLMAERMLVSVQTLQRLEAGDPTVGLAVLVSALHVLGMTQRLASLVAPESDRRAERKRGSLARESERMQPAMTNWISDRS